MAQPQASGLKKGPGRRGADDYIGKECCEISLAGHHFAVLVRLATISSAEKRRLAASAGGYVNPSLTM